MCSGHQRRGTRLVLPQFSQPVLHGYTPASARQLFDPVLEVGQGLVGPAYLLALDRETQEGAFAHGCQLAFDQVDFGRELSVHKRRIYRRRRTGGLCRHVPAWPVVNMALYVSHSVLPQGTFTP